MVGGAILGDVRLDGRGGDEGALEFDVAREEGLS